MVTYLSSAIYAKFNMFSGWLVVCSKLILPLLHSKPDFSRWEC